MKQIKETNKAKKSLLPLNTKEKAKKKIQVVEVTLPSAITNPTASTLKPFKEAAKRNQKLLAAKIKKEKEHTTFLAKPLAKGKFYKLDLRLRSPEALSVQTMNAVEAAPALVRLAKVKGLNAIAVTDYYDCSQIELTRKAALGTPVTIIPGLCVNCKVTNDSIITNIILFPEAYSISQIEACTNELQIPKNIRGRSDYVLKLEYGTLINTVEKHGGIIIPTRVDLTPHHLLSIPKLIEEYGIHCFDLAHPDNHDFFKQRWPKGQFTFFSFSNASSLAQIGSRMTKIKMLKSGFDGIKEIVKRRK